MEIVKFNKVLMIGFEKSNLEQDYWNRINNITEELTMLSKDSSDILNHLSTADCLLVKLGATVNKETMDNAPNLKYIGMFGTGYGRIDTEHATKKGITVCNVAGYSTESVAEFAFGIILEHIRELERGKKQAREGNYSESSFFNVYEIKDKKFGVIGLGKIGSRIAEIALDFGADVRYWSRTRKKEYEVKGIKYQEIENILADCDFISLNLMLNKDTEGFLNDERMQKIKPDAVIINLAPMELVDIDALSNRLEKSGLTFILDHSDEMTPEQLKQLTKYKNCIIYPPIAYTTKEATLEKQRMFVNNLENFLKGTPTNKVN